MSFKTRFLAAAPVSLALLFSPGFASRTLLAQVVSTNGGSIQGTITDASGAAVPNADVQIASTETGLTRTAKTDGAGYYSVGPLTPGNYRVTVTSAGFQTLKVSTVVRVGTATSGSFKLAVGQSTETIEVEAGAVQVNTDQVGVSDVLTAQQIASLPINGRNFLDVAQIEPGVVLQAGGSFDPTKAGYSALSIGGVSGRTTRILLDGQDITDETVGTTIFNVSEGAIGEFQLNRSTQDVSGDVTSTGQVLVTTKTGTNQFHGELFYNFQDGRAGAATAGGVQPPFQRNQFGGSLGGFIWKDKLFFFGNAERIKQDASVPALVGGPFAAQYAGLTVSSPYRETYSTVRLDYNGPFSGRYFVRLNYNVNSLQGNFGQQFQTYANRDNTPGIAGGVDYQFGKFTHSFRASYEKFHNLIADTSSSQPVNLIPGVTYQFLAGSVPLLASGPNVDAPQGTFQTDKQFRYDGSWTKGAHTVRYGYNLNYIQGGGFANFFGLGPRMRVTSGTLLDQCGNTAISGSCASDPLNGYHASGIYLGNGLGYFTERPGFGLIGSGVHDWRQGAYIADAWKVTPNFTFSAGLRWSIDTDRANQDVADIPCSVLQNSGQYTSANMGDLPCTGSTSLLSQYGSQYALPVHQPYANLSPQIGFAWAPGDHKTVFRAGAGIFFEGDVFNNTTNARTSLLAAGPFFAEADNGSICGSGQFTNSDGSITNSATVNGRTLTISQICAAPISVAAPYAKALEASYQAGYQKNPTPANSQFIGNTLDASGTYGAPYRTPYSEQFNFGVQREIFKGAVLSLDYVHNSTIKIAQTVDVNHLGAARFLNTTAARNAVAATLTACGVQTVDQAMVACPGLHTNTDGTVGPATIFDFAGNGLDSAGDYLSGQSPAANGLTVATGAAFPGQNAKLGSGAFLLPVGRSGYDAFQVVFREQKSHPVPGIERSNLQVSYNLSRIVSSSNNTTSDQFFSSPSWSNDNPTAFIGRALLDRKHQVSFGGSFLVKYGPEVGVIGHFYSALPQTLTLDDAASPNNPTANIFRTDLDGDGTYGDLAPGTLPGDYMHRLKAGNLGSYINSFNQTYAGRLTPAGQALVNAGVMTQAQLVGLGGAIQSIDNNVSGRALANPMYQSLDLTLSYPIRFGHYVHTLGESAMLEPKVAFYNVGNFANFGGGTNPGVSPFGGVLSQTGTGNLNGPVNSDAYEGVRVVRQSGTFDQGGPRTTEFQLRLTF